MKIQLVNNTEQLENELKGIQDFLNEVKKSITITPDYAVQMAQQATMYTGMLAEIRANIEYSVAEYERAAKASYAKKVLTASGSAADKREAEAKTDEEYQGYLSKVSELKAMQLLTKDLMGFLDKAYHLYRSAYLTEVDIIDRKG